MLLRSSFGILLSAVFVTAQPSAPRSAEPHVERAPCPFPAEPSVLEQVRCGYVTVLENRATPDGRRLRLAVAILKSRSATPRADPVVRLGGRPGDQLVRDFYNAPREKRDTRCVDAIPPIPFVTAANAIAR